MTVRERTDRHESTRRLQAEAVRLRLVEDSPEAEATVDKTALDDNGEPRGLTSNAISSVSAEPPLVLVCVDKRSNTLPALRHSRRFVVNFLSNGRGDLSNLFASKAADKFADVAWRPAGNGMPWLHVDSLAHAECTTEQEIDAGDHVILIGRVTGGQPPSPGTQPLMYFRRTYGTWQEPVGFTRG